MSTPFDDRDPPEDGEDRPSPAGRSGAPDPFGVGAGREGSAAGGPDPDVVSPGDPPDLFAAAGLDPDAAIGDAGAAASARPAIGPVIDTRRYQRMIGAFGLALVIAFSIYLFLRGGNGTPGIGVGQHLHTFVAPLATAPIPSVGANAHPVCNPARPARYGLNVCDRRPIVLSLFALGAKPCISQVNALQQLAPRFPNVQFAAVAVDAPRSATAALVRREHWTIPVGYDESGAIGQLYGVEVCPLLEVANARGTVLRRLIGEAWQTPGSLTRVVAALGS